MTEPQFDPGAELDHAEAFARYLTASRSLADDFERGVNRIVGLIYRSPAMFPRCDERHRCVDLRRYPYRTIFRDDRSESFVVAIAHQWRDPDYWTQGRG